MFNVIVAYMGNNQSTTVIRGKFVNNSEIDAKSKQSNQSAIATQTEIKSQ